MSIVEQSRNYTGIQDKVNGKTYDSDNSNGYQDSLYPPVSRNILTDGTEMRRLTATEERLFRKLASEITDPESLLYQRYSRTCLMKYVWGEELPINPTSINNFRQVLFQVKHKIPNSEWIVDTKKGKNPDGTEDTFVRLMTQKQREDLLAKEQRQRKSDIRSQASNGLDPNSEIFTLSNLAARLGVENSKLFHVRSLFKAKKLGLKPTVIEGHGNTMFFTKDDFHSLVSALDQERLWLTRPNTPKKRGTNNAHVDNVIHENDHHESVEQVWQTIPIITPYELVIPDGQQVIVINQPIKATDIYSSASDPMYDRFAARKELYRREAEDLLSVVEQEFACRVTTRFITDAINKARNSFINPRILILNCIPDSTSSSDTDTQLRKRNLEILLRGRPRTETDEKLSDKELDRLVRVCVDYTLQQLEEFMTATTPPQNLKLVPLYEYCREAKQNGVTFERLKARIHKHFKIKEEKKA